MKIKLYSIRNIINRKFDKKSLEKIYNIFISDYKRISLNKNRIIRLKFVLLIFCFNPFIFPNKFWINFILSISNNELRYNFQKETINIFNRISLHRLSLKDLDLLYVLSLRFGLYKISYAIRQKMMRMSLRNLKSKNINQIHLKKGIAALIELRQYKLSISLIKKITNKLDKDLFNNYLYVMKGIGFSIEESNLNDKNHIYELHFKNIIKNSSILIVGPTSIRTEKVKKFDISILCNYLDSKKQNKYEGYLSTRNLSYLSSEQSSFYNNLQFFDNKIDYFITRSKLTKDKILLKNPNLKIRNTLNFKNLLYRGNLNLIPNAIFDILFSNQEIKNLHVIKSDLMLTIDRVPNYYPSEWKREGKMKEIFLLGMSISHDPITQYRHLSNFYIKKKISGDLLFSNTMNGGLIKYINNLEKIYGIKI